MGLSSLPGIYEPWPSVSSNDLAACDSITAPLGRNSSSGDNESRSRMEFKEQLRAQVDIVRVASDYVRLRRAGKNYSGLCPFHNEKTPSFSISQEHQYFRCFGC